MMSKATKGAMTSMDKQIKKNKGEFQGWAMSIMFFGMAMKRIFDSAWKAGKTTFQDIMHSVEGTVTGFDHLDASVKYLGFTIGAAFEPIAEFLAPIVWAIAEWVNENPKLAAGLLLVVGVLGTILFFIGTMVLGIAGLIAAFNIISPVMIAAGSAIAGFFVGITAPVWALVAVILSAIAIIIVAWKANLGGIQEFFEETFSIIKKVFASIWKDITVIFENFIEFFKNIFTGNWEKAWDNLILILHKVVVIIIKIFIGLGALIVNAIILAVNLIVDTFYYLLRFVNWLAMSIVTLFIWLGGQIAKALIKPLQDVINLINAAIRAINRMTGRSFKTINVDMTGSIDNTVASMNDAVRNFFDGTAENIKAWQDLSNIGYISGDFVGQALENVDNMAGTVINNYDITVNQQPGETSSDTIQSVMDEAERRRA